MSDNKKLSLYKSVKNTFVYDDYLDVLNVIKFRYCFVNFRIGSHALGVELELYKNTPPENKLCICSTLNCMEHELHIPLVCDNYSVIRSSYLKYYYEYPTVFKKRLIMSSDNPNIINSVATYLYYAFQKRNSQLNT